MSDLQDLIATNAVRAYNEGFERGATEERERIIKLLEEHNAAYWESECSCGSYMDKGIEKHRMALIKGEQK